MAAKPEGLLIALGKFNYLLGKMMLLMGEMLLLRFRL